VNFDGVVEDVKVLSLTLNEGGETVFQYGSNCSAERLNSRERLGGAAIPIGIAETVEDYQLEFDVWSDGNNCAAADMVKTQGKKVWGVLYEIPGDFVRGKREDKRKTLQQIEGKSYEAIRICLRDTCGIEQRATTFVAREKDRRGGIKTSLEYVRHIVTGLREQAVRNEYIEELKKTAAENNPEIKRAIEAL
jgi:cation transport regulator ChaC